MSPYLERPLRELADVERALGKPAPISPARLAAYASAILIPWFAVALIIALIVEALS